MNVQQTVMSFLCLSLCAFNTVVQGAGNILGQTTWTAGNGHSYAIVEFPGETWASASTDIGVTLPGYHLATITTQAEQDFVWDFLVTTTGGGWEWWLGGFQDVAIETDPAEGWEWVTGESWAYTNWLPGEPNDAGGIENHLAMDRGFWNDEGTAIGAIGGYLAEAAADPAPYEGTATLCFIGAAPPSVEQKGKNGVTYVSDAVSLYYIQTAPVGTTPPAGLVNGWEVLTSDMKITNKVYWLDWTGVLTPTAYVGTTGTVLEETASIKTKDLSTLSGTWQGTGDLVGTSVDYVLVLNPAATPDCPSEYPPQCADILGGCLPAEPPYVEGPTVYDMSGFVN